MALKLGLVFREVPFTADELKMLILKFIKIFSILPLMDLPPLVYNVLSLSGDVNIFLNTSITFRIKSFIKRVIKSMP